MTRIFFRYLASFIVARITINRFVDVFYSPFEPIGPLIRVFYALLLVLFLFILNSLIDQKKEFRLNDKASSFILPISFLLVFLYHSIEDNLYGSISIIGGEIYFFSYFRKEFAIIAFIASVALFNKMKEAKFTVIDQYLEEKFLISRYFKRFLVSFVFYNLICIISSMLILLTYNFDRIWMLIFSFSLVFAIHLWFNIYMHKNSKMKLSKIQSAGISALSLFTSTGLYFAIYLIFAGKSLFELPSFIVLIIPAVVFSAGASVLMVILAAVCGLSYLFRS